MFDIPAIKSIIKNVFESKKIQDIIDENKIIFPNNTLYN